MILAAIRPALASPAHVFWLCLPLFLLAQVARAADDQMALQMAPMPVLTDTAEYCDQLQARVNNCAVHPTEVKTLVREGRQMCDHGEIRGGIARLRRALMIEKQDHLCR